MCDLFEAGIAQSPVVQAAIADGTADAMEKRPPKVTFSGSIEAMAYRHAYGTTAFHEVKESMLANAVVVH